MLSIPGSIHDLFMRAPLALKVNNESILHITHKLNFNLKAICSKSKLLFILLFTKPKTDNLY